MTSLAGELPTFDPALAPGRNGSEAEDASDMEPLAPETPTNKIVTPFKHTVPATGKPDTLLEAFSILNFPEDLHEPFLNLVGTEDNADPSVVASLPFESFREAVSKDLVLEEGRSPTLFEQGRFYKFFKDLGKLLAPPATPPAP